MELYKQFLYNGNLFFIQKRSMAEQSAEIVIWTRPRAQSPFELLAGFVPGSSESNSSDTLVNNQLVCLLPVGIRNPVCHNGNYCLPVIKLPLYRQFLLFDSFYY